MMKFSWKSKGEAKKNKKKPNQNANQNRGMPSKSFKVRNSFYLCQWLWFSRIKIKVLTVGRALRNAELSLWKPGISATVRLCLDGHGLLVPALANSAPSACIRALRVRQPNCRGERAIRLQQSATGQRKCREKKGNQPKTNPTPRRTAEIHPIFQVFSW